jgi:hypothetical protein
LLAADLAADSLVTLETMAVQPEVPAGHSPSAGVDVPPPESVTPPEVPSLMPPDEGSSLVVCPSMPGPVTVITPLESPVVAVVSTGRPPVVSMPVVSGYSPLVSVGSVAVESPGRLESVVVVGMTSVGTVMTGDVLITGAAALLPSSPDAT